MLWEVNLDDEFCRSHFPAVQSGWVFMENAGGTLVPRQVVDCAASYMTDTQVQPDEWYDVSIDGSERIEKGRAALAALINANVDEIVIGPSTTSNVYVLSHALSHLFEPGDEIIVTNQDHEANNGAWRNLEKLGVVIREWQMSPATEDLEIEDLEALLSAKTKLVCFNHCSNVVGVVHDVKTIIGKIHDAGALACVDGVAFVPHARVDVKDLDADFYLYSPYKVFGPHLGVLYGKPELLAQASNQSHFFLREDEVQRRLCPGGLNFELTAACAGMATYFDAVHEHHFPGANLAQQDRLTRVFKLFADHETKLADRIEAFLDTKPSVRLIGKNAPRPRVGVFSFLVDGEDSQIIPKQLNAAKIGIYGSDFYAARCIDALGARSQNGVIRVSLAHYNSGNDVDRLTSQLDAMIPSRITPR